MPKYDLIVIGGGAAGLMACASAIRVGKNVLLLEKNTKLGVKILMSGGTRCNITHNCDTREIVSAFGPPGRFLHSALSSLPPVEVVHLIESTGVITKIEPGGKVFPVSDKAIDVRDALVQLATDPSQTGHCEILINTPCREITKQMDDFTVATDSGHYSCRSVLITTGGKSYPGCGTTGDGYAWAKSFGHEIVTPVAALSPITNNQFWTHKLKGIAFDRVLLKVIENGKKKPIDQRNGAFLFTHFGYSGPSSLDISRAIARSKSPQRLTLECDFEPDLNREQLEKTIINSLRSKSKQSILNVLSSRYTKRFCEAILEYLEIDTDTRSAELSKADLKRLISNLKQSQFPIAGVYGFKKAEVTAGGVDLKEIDSRSMESKLCPGLYFAGEVMDLDGPIGGYNFQAAFSTGWLAGQQNLPAR